MQNVVSPHILIIDDDQRLRLLLQKYLRANGFMVSVARSAAEAREILSLLSFDLLIVDVMMPGESGYDLTRSLKEGDAPPPIILLTAMGEADNRIYGLEAGADDYVPKPFEPKELLLRMQNILRRTRPISGSVGYLKIGPYLFDPEKYFLYQGEQEISLTEAEGLLLKMLSQNPGIVMSRDTLAELCHVSSNPRAIDVQVTRLRRKIEADSKNPRYLQTVRHKGYVLWAS